MVLFVTTNLMFMICFCTNLKGIHNEGHYYRFAKEDVYDIASVLI